MTDLRRTEIARSTSSERTELRRCIFADASAIRMIDSMWRTAMLTPPEADSRRSSAYTPLIFSSSIDCSAGRDICRAYMMYFRRSVWSIGELTALPAASSSPALST